MNNKKLTIYAALLLIILGVGARLFPHPPNFAPIAAIALFGGLYLPRRYALIVPMIAMLLSDLFIGFYSYKIMLSVYLSFAVVGLIGLFVSKRKKFSTILTGTLAGSIIFFLVTNAAVWVFGTMYTHDLSGLFQSYTMALPFFKNTLLGDLFYVSILVGSMEGILALKKQLAKQGA